MRVAVAQLYEDGGRPLARHRAVTLQIAREDYEDRRERQRQGVVLAKQAGKYGGRKHDANMHARILALRAGGSSIAVTAKLSGYSQSQVKRICAAEREKKTTK